MCISRPSLRVRPEDFPSWKETYKVLRYGTQLANRAGIDQALRHYDTYSLLDPAAPDAVAQLLNGCTLLDKSVPPPPSQRTPTHTITHQPIHPHTYQRSQSINACISSG